jgi:hypothetical protein
MKRSLSYLFVVVLAILFVGCANSWVNLDNSKAENIKLKEALKKCNYDDKKYKLNEEQNQIFYLIAAAKLEGKAKESWEKFSKDKEIQFDKEMSECMQKNGFKRLEEKGTEEKGTGTFSF